MNIFNIITFKYMEMQSEFVKNQNSQTQKPEFYNNNNNNNNNYSDATIQDIAKQENELKKKQERTVKYKKQLNNNAQNDVLGKHWDMQDTNILRINTGNIYNFESLKEEYNFVYYNEIEATCKILKRQSNKKRDYTENVVSIELIIDVGGKEISFDVDISSVYQWEDNKETFKNLYENKYKIKEKMLEENSIESKNLQQSNLLEGVSKLGNSKMKNSFLSSNLTIDKTKLKEFKVFLQLQIPDDTGEDIINGNGNSNTKKRTIQNIDQDKKMIKYG